MLSEILRSPKDLLRSMNKYAILPVKWLFDKNHSISFICKLKNLAKSQFLIDRNPLVSGVRAS
jgi:hypothetical protein